MFSSLPKAQHIATYNPALSPLFNPIKAWAAEHGKTYTGPSQFKAATNAFVTNARVIDELNAENDGATYALNQVPLRTTQGDRLPVAPAALKSAPTLQTLPDPLPPYSSPILLLRSLLSRT